MSTARVTSQLSGPGFSLAVTSEGSAVQGFVLSYGHSRVVWDSVEGLTLTHDDSGEITGGHKMAPIVRRGAEYPDPKLLAAIRGATAAELSGASFVVDLIERHAPAFGKVNRQPPRVPYAFLQAVVRWSRSRQVECFTELAALLRRETSTAPEYWQPHIEAVAVQMTACAADESAANALWRDAAQMERVEAAANASDQLHNATVALLNRYLAKP